MLLQWFITHPVVAGTATFVLMWTDWLLTVWQQKLRQAHGSDHTRTYPVDTIEGNPLLRPAVEKTLLFEPKHLVAAILVSVVTVLGLLFAPPVWQPVLLGYVWGLFLIVDTTHLGNLIGYQVCRRGTHGQLWLHHRTAFLVQAGRYAALAAFLVVLAVVSASPFVAGVAIAGVSSTFRQFVWLRRIPQIPPDDASPCSSEHEQA